MSDLQTKGLHFGSDTHGHFLCLTDGSGTFRRFRLNPSQTVLLADQASAEALKIASRAVRGYDSIADIEGSFNDAYAAAKANGGWAPR